jgi:mannose-6-phosphate isomerase
MVKEMGVNSHHVGYSALSVQELGRLMKRPLCLNGKNFADYVWGGYELYKFKGLERKDTDPLAAESWEISGHPKYPSRIELGNGQLITLPDVLKDSDIAKRLLGESIAQRFDNTFPLIIKFFDAQKRMSVQVHPSDEIAASLGEKDPGKGEIFVVLDVYPNAEGALYLGLKDEVSRADFESALENNVNLLDLMHKIHVRKGEVYALPSGVLHCWTGGTMAVEITEASDLTYRLYDFYHGRPIHHKKGLMSIDFNNQNGKELEIQTRIRWKQSSDGIMSKLSVKSWIDVERIQLSGDQMDIDLPRKGDTFEALLGLKGSALLTSHDGAWNEILTQGYSLLIPSIASSYRVRNHEPNKPSEFLRISVDDSSTC